jgi:competence protein ComEA
VRMVRTVIRDVKHRAILSIGSSIVAMSILVAGLSGAARQDPPPPSGEGMPDGPGKEITVKICGICHEARRAASVRLTRDGWSSVIEDMVKRGAKGSEDELALVLDYLSANFLGEAPRPINVNNAPQIDLESVIGLLRKEASAIITYREKNGPFKKIEDMKKVPGLDYKKVEAAKDRIVCF